MSWGFNDKQRSALGLNPTKGLPQVLRDDLQRYYETHLGGSSAGHVAYVENFFGRFDTPLPVTRFLFNDGTPPVLANARHLYAWLGAQGYAFNPAQLPHAIRRGIEADAQIRRLDGLPPLPKPDDLRSRYPQKKGPAA